MSKESVNLYLSIQSGSSERTLVSLTDKTRALDKETQLLQQATEGLTKANKPLVEQQTKLQAQLKASQKTVNELQKAYNEYGDEMMKLDLDEAVENHAKLKQELTEVNAQLNANQKTYKEYLETVRKGSLDNAGTSSDNLGGGSDLSAVWGGLGIGEELSSLTQQISGTLLASTFGGDIGGIASNALSKTISGAALGTALAPGIGTALGAAFGGLSGLYSGAIEQWEHRDDAFKDYYGGLYDDVKGRSGEMVESGTSLASGRETNRISFKTLFGDEDAANEYLENLIDMANTTPFLYDDLVSMSKTLATYGYDEKNILPLLQTIGDAGAALGMGTSDMDAVAQALGRMKSSDKAALEYLNMLNDRGIGAVGMLAEAKGVDQGKMYEMISKGSISGGEAVEIITAALKESYTGSMKEQSETFSGLTSTLEGLQQNLDALGGEGYNTLRKEGVQEEVNALGGALGEAIGEINRVMGENQARKENMQEQYLREVVDTVLNGTHGELWSTFSEKQQADLSQLTQDFAMWSQKYEESGGTDVEAGAQMEALYEAAQTTAQAYFDNSDFMKILNETEENEIEVIRENTAGLTEATQAAYRLSQALSKGIVSTVKFDVNPLSANGSYNATNAHRYGLSPTQSGTGQTGRRHAFGLDRVPYNEYPALLHEGERVLTASQARAQDTGQAGAAPIQVTVTGNSFTGLPEEMADQLAEILLRKLTQAATAAAPK